MSGDYVSRDYLLGEYDRQHQGPPGGARKIIAEAPAADVVEVVRCGECIRKDICRTSNVWAVSPDDNWFCADGERKDGGQET